METSVEQSKTSLTNGGRKVQTFSTQDNQMRTFEGFTGQTWADLKGFLGTNNVNHNNMKVVLRETRATLDLDTAILPETDFTIMMFPVQVKSGTDYVWSELGYNDIRKFASERGISGAGSVQDIKVRLERWEKNKSLKEDAASGKKIVPKEDIVLSNETGITPVKKAKAVKAPAPTHTPALDVPVSEDPYLKKASELHDKLATQLGEVAAATSLLGEEVSKANNLLEEMRSNLNRATPVANRPLAAIASPKRLPTQEELAEEANNMAKTISGIKR